MHLIATGASEQFADRFRPNAGCGQYLDTTIHLLTQRPYACGAVECGESLPRCQHSRDPKICQLLNAAARIRDNVEGAVKNGFAITGDLHQGATGWQVDFLSRRQRLRMRFPKLPTSAEARRRAA